MVPTIGQQLTLYLDYHIKDKKASYKKMKEVSVRDRKTKEVSVRANHRPAADFVSGLSHKGQEGQL